MAWKTGGISAVTCARSGEIQITGLAPTNAFKITFLLLGIWLLLGFAPLQAQTPAPSPDVGSLTGAPPQPPTATAPAPHPIPLTDIVPRGAEVTATIHEMLAALQGDFAPDSIQAQLPEMAADIGRRLADTNRLVVSSPTLDAMRALENDWTQTAERLDSWSRQLSGRGRLLQTDLGQLDGLRATWQATLQAHQLANASRRLLAEMRETLQTLNRIRRRLQQDLEATVMLQDAVSDQQGRSATALAEISRRRSMMLERLLERDSPPLWRLRSEGTVQALMASLDVQGALLRSYVGRHFETFLMQIVVFSVLFLGLSVGRRHLDRWAEQEPALAPAACIFGATFATPTLITIVGTMGLYGQAPRLLHAVFGAAALFPAILILRRLLPRSLHGLLYALLVCYLFSATRSVFSAVPIASRCLFLVETIGACVFLGFLVHRASERREGDGTPQLWRITGNLARAAFVLLVFTTLANLAGNVSLAEIVGRTLFRSADLALLLYAAIGIVDAGAIFLMCLRPLSALRVVAANRDLLQRRVRLGASWLAVGLWCIVTLKMLSLRQPLWAVVRSWLDCRVHLGALSVSGGDVGSFGFAVWAAFAVSRFIRFVLEEDVYPRVNLGCGVPYAISTLTHYTVLLLGFFFALAVLGIDLGKFAVLAGAFGVGIGFGLQTVVNNFVSGLILLFERPVKVGDSIQIADVRGVVEHIGIRASVVRTWDNAEVIVPNGSLLSERVANWTFSSTRHGMELTVGVDPKASPQQVFELLRQAALAQPEVLRDPAPRVFFEGFGEHAWRYRLRSWTDHHEHVAELSSNIAVAVSDGLQKAGIEISVA